MVAVGGGRNTGNLEERYESFLKNADHLNKVVKLFSISVGDQDFLLNGSKSLAEMMEKHGIKRLPVTNGTVLTGIVTRSSLLQAVASMAREIPDPTADDDHIRDRIARAVNATDWRPIGFEVTVRNGVVHLHGIVTSDHVRQAAVVDQGGGPGVVQHALQDQAALVGVQDQAADRRMRAPVSAARWRNVGTALTPQLVSV